MIASLSEKVDGLVQQGGKQEMTQSDGQEEAPMAQKKEVQFFDVDEIGDGGSEYIGMFEVADDRLKRTSAAGEEGGEPHEPEHSATEHQFGSEFDDPIMFKVKETPTKEDRGTMRDHTTEQPFLSDIERMMANIAKLESEEKAAEQRSETKLTRTLAVEETDDPTKCEERALAKREAEEMQKLAERAKLAEGLRTRERELLASREKRSARERELLASREKQLQDSARIRRLQEEEREA